MFLVLWHPYEMGMTKSAFDLSKLKPISVCSFSMQIECTKLLTCSYCGDKWTELGTTILPDLRNALATVLSRGNRSREATVGTVAGRLRYRQHLTVPGGYCAVNTTSFLLSVARLVLTPTPNPKRPTKPKFHHEMARTFQNN